MGKLYELVLDAERQGYTEGDIGLSLIESILSNRKERDDIYRRGENKNFRNKELSRIISGLEKLDESHVCSFNHETLDDDTNLLEYREIFRINYGYDVVKCSFQNTGDINKTAEFLGVSLTKKARQFVTLSDYEKNKITDNQAYNEFLNNLKNNIRKKYHIILDSNI